MTVISDLAEFGSTTLRVGPVAYRPSPAASLAELMSGNARYTSGHTHFWRTDHARWSEGAGNTAPMAVVFDCSDSRVPAEILFDARGGDLFVVRTCAHSTTPSDLGSIEYAISHLHAPLLAVLGHDHCAALAFATDGKTDTDAHVKEVMRALTDQSPLVASSIASGDLAVAALTYRSKDPSVELVDSVGVLGVD